MPYKRIPSEPAEEAGEDAAPGEEPELAPKEPLSHFLAKYRCVFAETEDSWHRMSAMLLIGASGRGLLFIFCPNLQVDRNVSFISFRYEM